MDRLSSRSRFPVQCVLDKKEEQAHLAFNNARIYLFELQTTSKIQAKYDKSELKEDAINVNESDASVSNIQNVALAMTMDNDDNTFDLDFELYPNENVS